jgi:quinolinate synthase
MKLNTMEKLYLCMKNKQPQINLPEELMQRALLPIEKMLQMS